MSLNILVTTAISYPNGPPHIGHMYEAIIADIINRLYLGLGQNSHLLTGTDEHGKKIQQAAELRRITPQELCDSNSQIFKTMLSKSDVNYSRFIRTTDLDHIDLVKKLILKCKDLIYKTKYSGYYNIREENFITEKEAAETDFKDPVTGIPYEIKEEEAYKFKLSQFKDVINNNLHKVHGFNIKELTSRIEDLQDLTITRSKEDFTWVIDFPLDDEHIVYVWFENLLNIKFDI